MNVLERLQELQARNREVQSKIEHIEILLVNLKDDMKQNDEEMEIIIEHLEV